MRRAIPEPASLTVAVGNLRYMQHDVLITLALADHPCGQSERISMGSPNGNSPVAHGMTPCGHECVSIRKGNVFSGQFWLGLGVSELQNCRLCHLLFW